MNPREHWALCDDYLQCLRSHLNVPAAIERYAVVVVRLRIGELQLQRRARGIRCVPISPLREVSTRQLAVSRAIFRVELMRMNAQLRRRFGDALGGTPFQGASAKAYPAALQPGYSGPTPSHR